jgi:hypothetical protein
MSAVLPESSDMFSYMVAKAVNRVDYGGSLIRNVDAVWRFAEKSGLSQQWGVDRIQAHMARAFKDVRRRRPR